MPEFIYTLDQETTKEKTFLIVEIKEKNLNTPKRLLYRSSLVSSGQEKESKALRFLIQEHLKNSGISPLSAQADTLSFNRIRIPSSKSKEAITLLGATGNLFWKDKKLLVDPFSRMEFFLEASHESHETLKVEGFLKIGSGIEKIETCQWIFPSDPIWVVRNHIWQVFAHDVEGKWLRLVFPEAKLLKGKEREKFLEYFEEKEIPEGAPRVVWKNSLEPLSITKEVWPILQLKDRSGAFADLWMDYGAKGKVAAHEFKNATFRDVDAEKSWEKDLLETDFTKKIVDGSHYYCPLDKVGKSLRFLLEIGWTILDHQGKKVFQQKNADLSLKQEGSSIIVAGNIRYNHFIADLKDVVGAFNRREQFISLSPDTVGLIDREMIEKQWGDWAQHEIIESGIKIKKHHIGLLEDLFASPEVKKERALEKLLFCPKDFNLLPKESFIGTLHPYQQEGLNWLSFLQTSHLNGLLADEMGLGKTVQILAFLSTLYPNNLKNRNFNKADVPDLQQQSVAEAGHVRNTWPMEAAAKIEMSAKLKTNSSSCLGISSSQPVLIVAPTSLLFNWRKEIEKFLPKVSLYIHSGKDRTKEQEDLKRQSFILTSYALLRQDFALFQDIDFSVLILDEAQMIKNAESQVARCACGLKSTFRLAVTGTPIENRWEDLWSLFHFLEPGLLGDQKEFQANMLAAQLDVRYLNALRKKIRPFLLRRTKEEVALQLPEKIEQTVWIEMEEKQREFYESFLSGHCKGILKKVQEGGGESHRMEILEAILRLRQICCHPSLVDGSFSEDSAKLERVLSDLDEIISQKRKVLLYSQFTQMLRLIERRVKEKGFHYVYLDGSSKDREESVRRFQEDESVSLFLISLKAGGVGLNLTAADYIFLFDPWWNEAVEKQAIDRAHRLGREKTVIARRYVTHYSVEEKIMRIKEHKTKLARNLLDFDQELESLTLEDLYQLLQP